MFAIIIPVGADLQHFERRRKMNSFGLYQKVDLLKILIYMVLTLQRQYVCFY